MRSSVISLCISIVSDVYENMAFWVCMCVCVFMCPRVGVDAPVAVGMCMYSMPGEARGQYRLIPQGSFPCCWRPGLSLARNFTEEREARSSWPTSLLLPPLPS